MSDTCLVVTSINRANRILRELAAGCGSRGLRFILIGDASGPAAVDIAGVDFYNVDRQKGLPHRLAAVLPFRHYARKNIGYLEAIVGGAECLIETDDDNGPSAEFFAPRERRRLAAPVARRGWVNVYSAFTDAPIWPRGLPLETVRSLPSLAAERGVPVETDAPIQQGLADLNPDVDAVYRLLFPLPQRFRQETPIALMPGTWSPFNSQNTTWWKDAFPLLYLPSHCSFRMTDIWRGFVAQRIVWTLDLPLLFHAPTVSQDRNPHDILRDFADEVPGYLNNERIRKLLEDLPLRPGRNAIAANLQLCYRALISSGLVAEAERPLLDAWIEDLVRLRVL